VVNKTRNAATLVRFPPPSAGGAGGKASSPRGLADIMYRGEDSGSIGTGRGATDGSGESRQGSPPAYKQVARTPGVIVGGAKGGEPRKKPVKNLQGDA
jgi:hypothetical protein